MPCLKDLHCFIELPDGNCRLGEFGTSYGDGCVETFVAVPSRSQPFVIHLSSTKFIAPGLAMYVFIDGVYQCNRNRQNLKLRKPPDLKSLVSFVVRQKEERQDDGSMIARDWSFERLDIVSANEAPDACSPKVLENLGCIEVVVLRCAGTRSAKSTDTKMKPMNLDGAGDMPYHRFDIDGGPHSQIPQHDDRAWNYIKGGSRHDAPISASSHYHSGPPPQLSSQPHAGDIRYTSPVPMTSPQLQGILESPENLAASVRYGSGPIPLQRRAASVCEPAPSLAGAAGANIPFDPRWLDNALVNAVKRGIEGYQASSQAHSVPVIALNPRSSQLPGSWPSPFGPPDSPSTSQVQHLGTAPAPPPPAATLGLQSPPKNTHISWDQHLPDPSKDWNYGQGWESGEEENKADSWITGDTWDSEQDNSWRTSKHERKREPEPTGWNDPMIHTPSPSARTARTGRWTHSSDFHSARSRPLESVWESKVDGNGWTHIDASSDLTGSWALPVHPSESVSHVAAPSVVTFTANKMPPAGLLSSKFLSKEDEEMRRRFTTTASPVNQGPATHSPEKQHNGTGYSTFERFVRGTPSDIETTPAREENGSTAIPTAWAAVKKEVLPRDSHGEIVALHGSGGKRDIHISNERLRDNEAWRKATKATQDNGWGARETIGSSRDWSPASPENNEIAKDKWVNEKSSWETTREASWNLPAKLKDLLASDTSWQADINGWSAAPKIKGLANEPNPWITTSDSQNQPPESRLSKYRQLRSLATEAAAKGSRQFPPPSPEKKPNLRPGMIGIESEPLLKVSKEDSAKIGVEHQVRAGKGTKYGHAIGRPEYLDSLDRPYAVFHFKYRSHDTLRKLLGKDIVPSNPSLLITNPCNTLTLDQHSKENAGKDIKQRLKNVPKDALIDGLLDLHKKLDKQKKKKEMKVAQLEVEGIERTKDWVERQSREAGEKGKKNGKGVDDRWCTTSDW